ncbi:MAG: large subunit ribosomal protein L10 [archaeon GW2011_AR5]|nr:MAG: large subunit ribosomal protein L10 [archaeon GW2011_AR5]
MKKEDKPKYVEQLTGMINEYSVIGVLNMHKMPARALQQMRESMRGTTVIKSGKKGLITKALNGSKKSNINSLQEKLAGEPALLLTNENPFRLFRLIKENRTPAAAKPGDIAAKDITIPKGSTNLPPGPSISTLQKVGLKTSVQGGKIAVMADKVVCKAGEKIAQDLADVLALLKIEPMEIGLDLAYVWEDGTIYGKEVLDVSVEDYMNEVAKCVTYGVNLSVNIGYPTKLTIPLMLQKAFIETKALAVERDIVEKEFIEDILKKAQRAAKSLENKVQ